MPEHAMHETPPQVERLLGAYRAMLQAADPRRVVAAHLPGRPAGRTVVVGVGKAAAAMAQAVEAAWDGALTGTVVVPQVASLPLSRIRVLESAHPVPDERSVHAAQALLEAVSGLGEDDLVIALVSGGGSALCALPVAELPLAEKQRITKALLARGASIHEMNAVRKHLSAIKGGRLAVAAWPARVVTLVISDIPGDDPALVASGPTLPTAATPRDALEILGRYGIAPGPVLARRLESEADPGIRPGDARLARNTHRVVASAFDGLRAAADTVRATGLACHILGDAIEGEARDVARVHAGIVQSIARHGQPFTAPCVLLSGGEATVTLRAEGRGGRNTEFALALALALGEAPAAARVHALSAGTDGLDGRAGAAGAWIAPESLARARALGLAPRELLDRNDSATLFDRIGTLVHTGPTHTNVNDFRAILIEPA
jgi:hydroxypyruvate reductase